MCVSFSRFYAYYAGYSYYSTRFSYMISIVYSASTCNPPTHSVYMAADVTLLLRGQSNAFPHALALDINKL